MKTIDQNIVESTTYYRTVQNTNKKANCLYVNMPKKMAQYLKISEKSHLKINIKTIDGDKGIFLYPAEDEIQPYTPEEQEAIEPTIMDTKAVDSIKEDQGQLESNNTDIVPSESNNPSPMITEPIHEMELKNLELDTTVERH